MAYEYEPRKLKYERATWFMDDLSGWSVDVPFRAVDNPLCGETVPADCAGQSGQPVATAFSVDGN